MAKDEYYVARSHRDDWTLDRWCIWTPRHNILCACETSQDAGMIAQVLNQQPKQQPELRDISGAIPTRGKWESGKVKVELPWL